MNCKPCQENKSESGLNKDLARDSMDFYLPIVKYIRNEFKFPVVLDLGGGCTDWISFCNDIDFPITVITKVDEYTKTDLNGAQKLIFDHMALLESNSVSLITAFYLIEYMSKETVIELIEEAYRVLKPGGVILFETFNLEKNIFQGSPALEFMKNSFFPSKLLNDLIISTGFKKTKVLRRINNEISPSDGLLKILHSISPNYSVIGIKPNINIQYEEDIYPNSISISLLDTLLAYDLLQKKKSEHIESELEFLQINLKKLQDKINSFEAREERKFFNRVKRKIKRELKNIIANFPILEERLRRCFKLSEIKDKEVIPMSAFSKKIYSKLKNNV